MPTLYDNLKRAQSSYVPQFVGSEADTLKSVGDVLDNRYRANQASLDDALVTAANEEYAPGDEHIGKSIYGNLSKLRDDISSSDSNFENSSSTIRDAVRKHLATNSHRIQALRNAKDYNQYIQHKTELGSEGVDFTPNWKGTVNEDGSLNRFRSSLEKRLDYDKKKETFFNQFEADLQQGGFGEDARNPGFIKSIINGGISDKKVHGYLNEAFNRYKGSDEYIQEFKAEKQNNPNASNQRIDDVIKRSILSTGLEKVHNIRKEDVVHIPEYAMKKALAENPNQPTSPGAAKINTSVAPFINDTNSSDSPIYKKGNQTYLIKDKGTGKPVPMSEVNHVIAQTGTPSGGKTVEELYDLEPIDAEGARSAVDKQHEYLSKNMSSRQRSILQAQYPAGYTLDAHKQALQQSLSKLGQVVESGEPLTEGNRAQYESRLKGDLVNAPTVVEGSSKLQTLKTVIDDLKLGKNDKFEIVPSMINYTSPNKALGSNLESVIYVNGQPKKTVQTRLHDQSDAASRDLNDLLQSSHYSGVDKYTPENPQISNEVVNVQGNPYAVVHYTTTIPSNGEHPVDTEVRSGLAPITGRNQDGSYNIGKPQWDQEGLPANEYKAQYINIIKKKLGTTYGSGQLTDKDIKNVNP